MFFHLSVSHFVRGGVIPACTWGDWGCVIGGVLQADVHPHPEPEAATGVGGTHPTGMNSCSLIVLVPQSEGTIKVLLHGTRFSALLILNGSNDHITFR